MPSMAVQAEQNASAPSEGADGSSGPRPVELSAWMWSWAHPEASGSPEILTLQL